MTKINKKRVIYKSIVIILTFIGLFVTVVGVHEFTHVVEIKAGGFDVTQICLLNIDKSNNYIGYVEYNDYKKEITLNEPLALVMTFISLLILGWIVIAHFFPIEKVKVKK